MKPKKSIVFAAAALTSILTASGAKVVFDSATLNASSELSSVTLSGTPQDLATSTLTYADFSVTSSHTSLASTIGALDYGSGTSLPGIGVNRTGTLKIEEVSRDELLTVGFNQQVDLTQITVQGWGNNDDPVVIALASDPGVISVTTFTDTGAFDGDRLEAQPNGYSYSSGLLTLRINGFAHSTVVNFENAVSLNSFSIFSDTTNGGSGGVALGGFVYAIPEPSSALFGAMGLLMLLRRRR